MNIDINVVLDHLNSVINFTVGGYHPLMGVFITMQVIDVMVGLSKGFCLNDLSSRVMSQGISRKGTQWLIVVVAHMVDLILFEGTNSIMLIVLMAYIANEGLSIVENAAEMDVLVPDELKKHLKQVRDKAKTEDDKTESSEDTGHKN